MVPVLALRRTSIPKPLKLWAGVFVMLLALNGHAPDRVGHVAERRRGCVICGESAKTEDAVLGRVRAAIRVIDLVADDRDVRRAVGLPAVFLGDVGAGLIRLGDVVVLKVDELSLTSDGDETARAFRGDPNWRCRWSDARDRRHPDRRRTDIGRPLGRPARWRDWRSTCANREPKV